MQYTNQEAYNLVVRKLVAQGRPSTDRFSCMYISPNGDRCAAGHLLPDNPNLILRGDWPMMIKLNPDLEGIADIAFISNLQRAHDSYFRSPGWRSIWVRSMLVLARDYGLDSKLLEALTTEEWKKVQV